MADKRRRSFSFLIAFEEKCLALILEAYKGALNEKSISIDWNENDITFELNNIMTDSSLRRKWRISTNIESQLLNETVDKAKGYAAKSLRIDLRFVVWKKDLEFEHFMEAKKLKENDSDLKRRYIDTGVDSFIEGKYSNGFLAGYLMEGRIDETVTGINRLLKRYKSESEILQKTPHTICNDYYESNHPSLGVLKHIILDFTPLGE